MVQVRSEISTVEAGSVYRAIRGAIISGLYCVGSSKERRERGMYGNSLFRGSVTSLQSVELNGIRKLQMVSRLDWLSSTRRTNNNADLLSLPFVSVCTQMLFVIPMIFSRPLPTPQAQVHANHNTMHQFATS
jgi:hypothetical protein